MTTAVDRYVDDVMRRIAPGIPDRDRIEADLRAHLSERIGSGDDASRAVTRMGTPDEVARSFLAEVEPPLATPSARLGAFLFDAGLGAVAVAAIAGLAMALLAPYGPDGPPVPLGVAIGMLAALTFVLGFLYFPVLEALFGQTAGKRLFGTHVARETGERAGFGATVLRRIPLMFDFWPLDALFLPFTERRQRAFDMVAKTIVIEAEAPVSRAAAWTLTACLWGVAASLAAIGIALGA